MDTKELEELIRIFEASSLCEIEVEEDGRRMRLQKPQPVQPSFQPYPYMGPPLEQSGPVMVAEASRAESEPVVEAEPEDSLPTIDSPMVGTFYSAPAPGEDSFVSVGDAVEEGQTVCIVEAMKLMNEVGAKSACKIVKVLVENGEPVEFGQPLFSVDPA